MKVVVAIDSFKGSASSNELANAISKGILKVYKNAQIDIYPLGQNAETRYVILEDNIAVIGMLDKEVSEDVHEKGVTAYFSVLDSPMSLEEAIETKKTLTLIASIDTIFGNSIA